jgi:hypothetical protein
MDNEFANWMLAVEGEARHALDRTEGDVTWLLGSPEDMRECFDDGMSPAEYVRAQIEQPD